MLTLHTKQYTHQGKRKVNEDAIYPTKDRGDNLFLVCDGVGGCKNGQFASHLAIDFFSKKYKEFENPSENDISKIIHKLQIHFFETKTKKPELGNMATTIAGISFTQKKVLLFWVGDTHIFHFSKGLLNTESKDHSYINKLLDQQLITPEVALKHPHKNAIFRAINGNEGHVADIIRIPHVKVGDYFLIASDGVLEAISKEDLHAYFNPENNFNEVYHKIKSECLEHSRDNFSFYLIKVINLG